MNAHTFSCIASDTGHNPGTSSSCRSRVGRARRRCRSIALQSTTTTTNNHTLPLTRHTSNILLYHVQRMRIVVVVRAPRRSCVPRILYVRYTSGLGSVGGRLGVPSIHYLRRYPNAPPRRSRARNVAASSTLDSSSSQRALSPLPGPAVPVTSRQRHAVGRPAPPSVSYRRRHPAAANRLSAARRPP